MFKRLSVFVEKGDTYQNNFAMCVYKIWWKFYYANVEICLCKLEVPLSCGMCHAFSNLYIIVSNFVTVCVHDHSRLLI